MESERVVAYGTEGVPMLEPKIVRQIRELATQGWGSRRIAGELGVARNTVRRYLRGGGEAERHVSRDTNLSAVRGHVLFRTSSVDGSIL